MRKAQFLKDVAKRRGVGNHFQRAPLGDEQCSNPVVIDAAVGLQLIRLTAATNDSGARTAHLNELP